MVRDAGQRLRIVIRATTAATTTHRHPHAFNLLTGLNGRGCDGRLRRRAPAAGDNPAAARSRPRICRWTTGSGDCRCLRIRRAFRKQGIQPLVVTINIIEKVHSTVFLRDGGHVENKDRDLHRQVNLPIVFA